MGALGLRALATAGALSMRSARSCAGGPCAALSSRAIMRGRPLAMVTSRAAIRVQVTKVTMKKGGTGENGAKEQSPKRVGGFIVDDEDVARHVSTLDYKASRLDQSRSVKIPNYNPRHRVVIDHSPEALEKAARKARRDFVYEETLKELQIELVHLQEYVKANGLKVAILFEGRDAAGKGGVISRITSAMSPRVCRVCALGVPTAEERSQWYFQRYVKHLPSAGEIVLFDRSWYNRAGVERVMSFCTDEEYEEFMRATPLFEEMLINSGIILLKYWFSVSSQEQERRFKKRMSRSWKRWKLSPMDLYSRTKWEDYSKAKDTMMSATATEKSPWWIVPSTNKKEARLNCISHILASIDFIPQDEYEDITLPSRGPTSGYIRNVAVDNVTQVPIIYNCDDLFTKTNKGKKGRKGKSKMPVMAIDPVQPITLEEEEDLCLVACSDLGKGNGKGDADAPSPAEEVLDLMEVVAVEEAAAEEEKAGAKKPLVLKPKPVRPIGPDVEGARNGTRR